MPNLDQALVIVVVGITGVFVNLLVLMLVVMVIGRIFGKKPKKKEAS
jgi:Na+-transporting methylmalonyl-CoA/oxaloacetate decarboxylase gamma subunit